MPSPHRRSCPPRGGVDRNDHRAAEWAEMDGRPWAVAGAAHDLGSGAIRPQAENDRVGLLAAQTALVLDALSGREQVDIEARRTHGAADRPHRRARGTEEGAAGVLHRRPAVGDLDGLGQGSSRRLVRRAHAASISGPKRSVKMRRRQPTASRRKRLAWGPSRTVQPAVGRSTRSRSQRLRLRRAAVPHPGQRLDAPRWRRISCTCAPSRSMMQPGGTSDQDRSWRVALAPFAQPAPATIQRRRNRDRPSRTPIGGQIPGRLTQAGPAWRQFFGQSCVNPHKRSTLYIDHGCLRNFPCIGT